VQAEPWVEFRRELQEGRQGSGQIKSITDFGVFIGLPGGIDGLVHLSDLSWTCRRGSRAQLQEGRGARDDGARDRSGARAISLGVKQLDKDPLSADSCGASEGQSS
jgi:small subunit ribosomal protein S1